MDSKLEDAHDLAQGGSENAPGSPTPSCSSSTSSSSNPSSSPILSKRPPSPIPANRALKMPVVTNKKAPAKVARDAKKEARKKDSLAAASASGSVPGSSSAVASASGSVPETAAKPVGGSAIPVPAEKAGVQVPKSAAKSNKHVSKKAKTTHTAAPKKDAPEASTKSAAKSAGSAASSVPQPQSSEAAVEATMNKIEHALKLLAAGKTPAAQAKAPSARAAGKQKDKQVDPQEKVRESIARFSEMAAKIRDENAAMHADAGPVSDADFYRFHYPGTSNPDEAAAVDKIRHMLKPGAPLLRSLEDAKAVQEEALAARAESSAYAAREAEKDREKEREFAKKASRFFDL